LAPPRNIGLPVTIFKSKASNSKVDTVCAKTYVIVLFEKGNLLGKLNGEIRQKDERNAL